MAMAKGATKARKPTVLKIVGGTNNVTRQNKKEPKVHPEVPGAPEYLTKQERAAYERFAASLGDMRCTTKDDFAALEQLACTYAEMQRLRQALRDEDPNDLTYETFNKYGAVRRLRPELTALGDVDRKLLALLGRFGLTPADRSRVNDEGLDGEGSKPRSGEDEFGG
jgi:P27 family predicted phage terminase small subunit